MGIDPPERYCLSAGSIQPRSVVCSRARTSAESERRVKERVALQDRGDGRARACARGPIRSGTRTPPLLHLCLVADREPPVTRMPDFDGNDVAEDVAD